MACAACGSVAVRSCDRVGTAAVGHRLTAAERSAGQTAGELEKPRNP